MGNQRKTYPAGVPCWVDSGREDPEAAVRFYGGLFGWTLENAMPPDSPERYFLAELDGQVVAGIGSQTDPGQPAPVWNTYVSVEDIEASTAKVGEAGGQVVMGPFPVGPAGHMAVAVDPTGAAICLWQPGERIGADLVNAPGSWVFSDLTTPDVERALAFYHEVFGWESTTVDFGAGESHMLRLPGYADHLAENDPDIRERHASGGAPEGFSDAVAFMAEGEGPPRWAITFSVDDADAAAERARDLGGEVLAGPFEAGPTRQALIRDDQGATFTISKYTPPS